MKMRLIQSERGLKDEIRDRCSVDPLFHQEYTDIQAAQNAACASDAHFKSSSAAAAFVPLKKGVLTPPLPVLELLSGRGMLMLSSQLEK